MTYSNSTKQKWGLLLIAVSVFVIFRLFWNITEDCFTFIDEYLTFGAAVGFHRTGQFAIWDYVKECLSTWVYTRAWPHTILLSVWFSMFGETVVAGKVLSAVFGLLFAWSLLYVTMQIFHSLSVSLLAEILVFTNSDVCISFRQIRMYSLWMLCMVWLIYFSYRMMTEKVSLCRTDSKASASVMVRIRNFWGKWIGFSPTYLLIFCMTLFISYFVHVNSFLLAVGMCPFLVYLLAVKREWRYVWPTVLMIMLFALVILFIRFGGQNSFLSYLVTLAFYGDGSWLREEVNVRYWLWVKDILHSFSLTILLVSCICVALFRRVIQRKMDRQLDFSIYCIFLSVFSLLIFLFVLDRYYQARYILYVTITTSIAMAWGMNECIDMIQEIIPSDLVRKWIGIVACLGCVILCARSMARRWELVYDNLNATHHLQAYDVIGKDAMTLLPGEQIPIVSFAFQGYYGNKVLTNYTVSAMDRVNDYPRLIRLAGTHPKGYIAIETAKINGFQPGIKDLIIHYGDRIGGEGIDQNNMEIIRYHVLFPDEFNGDYSSFGDVTVLDSTANPVTAPIGETLESDRLDEMCEIRIDRDRHEAVIRIITKALPTDSDIIFLRYDLNATGESRGVQLAIPSTDYRCLTYRLKLDDSEDVTFQDTYEVHYGKLKQSE